MKKILVAGIGNIFFGDDAFGCEVASQLKHLDLPSEVTVIDYGIRSYDLAYALTDGYDATILVDAVPRGRDPGTVFLIEPDLENLDQGSPITPDAHSLDPVSVLKMAQSFGGIRGQVFLVGCEPASLEDANGDLTLSEPVRAAVPQAIEMIRSLLAIFVFEKPHAHEPVLK